MTDPRPVRPGTEAERGSPPTPEEIASQGAQVVLPPGSEAGSRRARQGRRDVRRKHQARDEGLEDMGLDPQDPAAS